MFRASRGAQTRRVGKKRITQPSHFPDPPKTFKKGPSQLGKPPEDVAMGEIIRVISNIAYQTYERKLQDEVIT